MPKFTTRPILQDKAKRFIDILSKQTEIDPASAAREAGYTNPKGRSFDLMRRYGELAQTKRRNDRALLRMTSEETLERLAEVARDKEHRDHVRALEILSKIQGLLAEKIVIQDKRQLQTDLATLLASVPPELQPTKPLTTKDIPS